MSRQPAMDESARDAMARFVQEEMEKADGRIIQGLTERFGPFPPGDGRGTKALLTLASTHLHQALDHWRAYGLRGAELRRMLDVGAEGVAVGDAAFEGRLPALIEAMARLQEYGDAGT